MSEIMTTFIRSLLLLACVSLSGQLIAAEAPFFRAINLNGPALEIDGRKWEGTNATNLSVTGKFFENQSVLLKPATDPTRARMIRSSPIRKS